MTEPIRVAPLNPDAAAAAEPVVPVPPVVPAVLAFDAVRFRWPGAADDVLDVATLRLAAGESLFLRGPSGCGKSTLLSLAAGVQLASAGAVRLLGHDWATLPPSRRDRLRAAQIGYLFQQFNLLPYLSVLDNVLLPCRLNPERAARAGVDAAAQRQRAQQLLTQVGLGAALWSRGAAELSVGQQQRVAAARALIGAPALVIADEPTSALDDAWRNAFMALLHQACAEARSALLFVSHDLRLAAPFDRVIDLPALNRAASALGAGVAA
ncbi:MAG: ATP-binding cassette domain-containing protein [Leptothrix sp. (in: b-proteobacteria)]